MSYIERNPVDAGLVGCAQEWRWSSVRRGQLEGGVGRAFGPMRAGRPRSPGKAPNPSALFR